MYKLESKPFGVMLTWSGTVVRDEVATWFDESRRLLPTLKKPWSILVNMVDMKPMPPEASELLSKGQEYYRAMGMRRSVVIVSSPTLVLQLRRVARESHIGDTERYIDASKYPADWESRALDWLNDGIDRTE